MERAATTSLLLSLRYVVNVVNSEACCQRVSQGYGKETRYTFETKLYGLDSQGVVAMMKDMDGTE